MMYKRYFTLALVFFLASCCFGAVPVTVDVLEVKKIWDKAPHNAFTDLVRWNDTFYCAFREGRGHVSTDGKIRILESKDGDGWESAALIFLSGYDLRDAHLSVTPDNRLMLIGGAAPRKEDKKSAPTGSFVSFSKNGKQWTKPQIVVEPGRWLWCVTWHEGKAYGVSYTAGSEDNYLDLLVSADGVHYETHVGRLFEQGRPSEVTLRFGTDGTCYALVRRDRLGDESTSAILGISKPDYTQWQWKDLGSEFNRFGGPNFIRIPGGHWIAAGRMYDGSSYTGLAYLDVKKGTMTKLTKLPSGRDNSYPGLVWHNDTLYVSYYSGHEGKTSIYLAKVKINHTDLTQAFLNADEILKIWEDHYAHFENMKVSYTHRVLEALPPEDDPNSFDSLVRLTHVERVEQGVCFHLRYSCDEEGFNKPDSIIEGSFDGAVTREYFGQTRSGMIIAGMIGRNTETMNRLKAYMYLDRQRLVRKNPSGPFEIYWIEDPNSKPRLSRTISRAIAASEVTVLPDLEPVAGQMCHVLEISRKGDLLRKIWLAHKSGMLLLKDQRYENNTPYIALDVQKIGCVKTDKGLVWYPKKAYQTSQGRGWGKIKYELITHEFVPNIQVDENTFRFDFRKGTQVHDRVRNIFGVDLPKEPPSLVGKSLPSLKNFNLRIDFNQSKDKKILICFWDMEQRPSRRRVIQLAKQITQLKEKGVVVIAMHALRIDKEQLDVWIKNNDIPFPVGMIHTNEKKMRFEWGVRSLPWLILTDRDHVVTAEGFGLNELDDKIRKSNGAQFR